MNTETENLYVLISRHSHPGRSGTTMWRYRWVSVADGVTYETTVDSSFRNWDKSGWRELAKDDAPYGAYTGLRRTKRSTQDGVPVITADSRPRLQDRLTREEAQAVAVLLEQSSAAQFEHLFDQS